MIDVNQFKRVNDLLGHPTGDALLRQVAEALRGQLRHADIVARYGGDEFIIALPEATIAQASAVAEKLRELDINGPWSAHPHIGPARLSVGVGTISRQDSSEAVIQEADADLYATRRVARSFLAEADAS